MQKINWKNHNISKLCLGTVQFGLNYGIANEDGEVSQDIVNNILNHVLVKNVNCFDTGSMYGNSEEKIGQFITKHRINDMRIISKIKSDFFDLKHIDAVITINKSLDRLSSNSLFALLLHNIDAIKNWNSTNIDLINLLKEQNKIQYFGVSIYTDEEFNLALDNDQVDIIQIPFNLLDQRAVSKNWLKKAKEKNKLIFIRSIYLQGLILMDIEKVPKHLESAKIYLSKIEHISEKLNITKNQLALSFVNQIATNSILLFGCDTLEQAVENIENYNDLPLLEHHILEQLKENSKNIDEYIYNPSMWSK